METKKKVIIAFVIAVIIGLSIGIVAGVVGGIMFVSGVITDIAEEDGIHIDIKLQMDEEKMVEFAMKIAEEKYGTNQST